MCEKGARVGFASKPTILFRTQGGWVDRFREDVLRLSRAVSTNLGAGLVGDTPVPSFFGELRRLNPRAPVVHLVRLESEGRVWVEHRARAAV